MEKPTEEKFVNPERGAVRCIAWLSSWLNCIRFGPFADIMAAWTLRNKLTRLDAILLNPRRPVCVNTAYHYASVFVCEVPEIDARETSKCAMSRPWRAMRN